MPKKPTENPIQDYVDRILADEIPACLYVKQACERHNRDLGREDLYFDLEAASRPIRYIENFRHYKGEWAGKPLRLEPWQRFIIGSLFGWKWRETGTRRFKYAYVAVPRKNGKTLLGAGTMLYLLDADFEAGAEVYTAATKEDQAKISFDDACAMVEGCGLESYKKRFKETKKPPKLRVPETHSKLVPLSREAKSFDGFNPHGVLVDEFHAHPNWELFNVLKSGMGARSQPLMLVITTAGTLLHGPCIAMEENVKSILNGTFDDDQFFGIVYTLDKDDLTDPKTGNRDLTRLGDPYLWEKANPNWGVSVLKKPALDDYKSAMAPASTSELLADLQTKRFNLWVNAASSWLSLHDWQTCFEPVDPESLRNLYCYGGLDLAQVRDLSAFALLFPPQAHLTKWAALVKYWCPKADIDRRSKEDRVPYRKWVDEGWITATPGKTTDYEFIQKDILDDSKRYWIKQIAFDRTFSGHIVQNLVNQALDMVEFGQGFISMSSPCKEFERMVLNQELNHMGNPILTWNAENAIVRRDPAGNIKIDKGDTPEEKRRAERKRVDGLVASVMALGLYLAEEAAAPVCEAW